MSLFTLAHMENSDIDFYTVKVSSDFQGSFICQIKLKHVMLDIILHFFY